LVAARITKAQQAQSILFEPDGLSGEVFRVTIPEIVSGSREPIVPWSQPSPHCDIGGNSASWSAEVPGRFRMAADVSFTGGPISATVTLTNLSPDAWDLVTAFACLAYREAPLFDDPELSRTYVPVEDTWRTVGSLFRDHDPGGRPHTFFPVVGGPALASLWLCREIPQWHSRMLSRAAACVVSRAGAERDPPHARRAAGVRGRGRVLARRRGEGRPSRRLRHFATHAGSIFRRRFFPRFSFMTQATSASVDDIHRSMRFFPSRGRPATATLQQ
jgi:hypothetical protein